MATAAPTLTAPPAGRRRRNIPVVHQLRQSVGLQRGMLIAGLVLSGIFLFAALFAPLLALPLLQLRWRPALGAIGVPVVMNLIAWPLTPGARDYLDVVVPYLKVTRDYANSSLSGFAVYFGMPGWAHATLFVLLAAAVAGAVLGLARVRHSQELLYLAVGSGVLLAGVQWRRLADPPALS